MASGPHPDLIEAIGIPRQYNWSTHAKSGGCTLTCCARRRADAMLKCDLRRGNQTHACGILDGAALRGQLDWSGLRAFLSRSGSNGLNRNVSVTGSTVAS